MVPNLEWYSYLTGLSVCQKYQGKVTDEECLGMMEEEQEERLLGKFRSLVCSVRLEDRSFAGQTMVLLKTHFWGIENIVLVRVSSWESQ